MEGSLGKEQQEEILAIVRAVPGVKDTHKLRTRAIGQNASISLHIIVSSSLNIRDAHDIATKVEIDLRDHFGRGTYLSVHVEPD